MTLRARGPEALIARRGPASTRKVTPGERSNPQSYNSLTAPSNLWGGLGRWAALRSYLAPASVL